jgi:hypothetical protein
VGHASGASGFGGDWSAGACVDKAGDFSDRGTNRTQLSPVESVVLVRIQISGSGLIGAVSECGSTAGDTGKTGLLSCVSKSRLSELVKEPVGAFRSDVVDKERCISICTLNSSSDVASRVNTVWTLGAPMRTFS